MQIFEISLAFLSGENHCQVGGKWENMTVGREEMQSLFYHTYSIEVVLLENNKNQNIEMNI